MDSKTIGKYLFIAGIVLAILLALLPTSIEGLFWLVVFIGFVGGLTRVSKESETNFIVLVIGLYFFGDIFAGIPVVGEYLVAILNALTLFLGAAVLAVVFRNVISWLKP